jgi:hypothetical protein
VPVNERRRLEIGQERVVLHQSAHPFVLTWAPSAGTLGKLVDALVLDRALCLRTEELLRVLLAESARLRRARVYHRLHGSADRMICGRCGMMREGSIEQAYPARRTPLMSSAPVLVR